MKFYITMYIDTHVWDVDSYCSDVKGLSIVILPDCIIV